MFHGLFLTTCLAAISGILPGTAVYAQSTDSICSRSTILIDTLETLEAVQNCTTVEGDIVIQYGEDLPSEIEFPVLEEIGGSFLSLNFEENILAWRLAAPRLERLGADLYISRWVNLTTIDMPVFDEANRIRLNNLPRLTSANLLSTVTKIENNYEVWNTSLTNITNDGLTYATFVEIFDNFELETLELSALRNASFDVALRRNRPGVDVRLPSLEEVWYFELQEIGSLEVPVLETVIGHFVVNMSSLESLNAPNLTTVGIWYDPHLLIGDNLGMIITNNDQLDTISLPELKDVRLDVVVRNNTALRQVDLPALAQVYGNVALEGPFDEVTIPGLDKVGGEFTIGGQDQSSSVCGPFQTLKNNGDIRGRFSCPRFAAPPVRSRADLGSENMRPYVDGFIAWAEGGESGSGSSSGGSSGGSNAGASLTAPGFVEFTAMFGALGFILRAL